MKSWITKTYLESLKENPKLSLSCSNVIQRQIGTSKSRVNELLERERYTYIVSGKRSKILDDDDAVIHSVKRILLLKSGEQIIIQPGQELISNDEGISFGGKNYSGAQEIKIPCITIVKRNALGDQKPSEGSEFKSVTVNGTDLFILNSELSKSEQYENPEQRVISLMELTHIDGINSDKDKIKLLEKYFSTQDIDTPDFLEIINIHLEKAKKILSERAPHLTRRGPFKKLSHFSFQTKQDILYFLDQSNSLDKYTSVLYCTLLKYIYLFQKYSQNPTYQFLEKIEIGSEDITPIILKIFNLPKETLIQKDNRGVYKFEKKFDEYGSTPIEIAFRIKKLDSFISKALAKGEYLEIEDFSDIFGISIYIPESMKRFTISVIQQFDSNILNAAGKIKNKGLLTQDTLTWYGKTQEGENKDKDKEYHDGEKKSCSLDKYKKAISAHVRNTGTATAYDDVKLLGTHTLNHENISLSIGTEIKFLYGSIETDKNETGLAFYPVYEYFAKHFEGEKNRNPFISALNISELLDNFFDILQDKTKNYPQRNFNNTLKEIYEELNTASHKGFPSGMSIKDLKIFYEKEIKQKLFLYFAEQYGLEAAKYGKEIVFTTTYNREQLLVGGRGYTLSS